MRERLRRGASMHWQTTQAAGSDQGSGGLALRAERLMRARIRATGHRLINVLSAERRGLRRPAQH